MKNNLLIDPPVSYNHGVMPYARKAARFAPKLPSLAVVGLGLLFSAGVVSAALAQSSSDAARAATTGAPEGKTATAAALPIPDQTSANPGQANNVPGAAPDAATATPTPTGLWERSNLLGDMGGLRPWLGNYGVTFGMQETSEYLTNLSGGSNRRGAYDGLTQLSIDVDSEKAFGWAGGTFNVSALQIHGSNLSATTLHSLQFASGIEADAGTRLWELWYQQAVLDGRADVKIGQQSLDQEFMTSQYASNFMNLTFGWPILPSIDLPSGGPAYPLSSLGVRAGFVAIRRSGNLAQSKWLRG